KAVALEVVARRIENGEVDGRCRLVADTVALGAGARRERVVEGVEIGAERDGRSLRVQRPIASLHVPGKTRGGLDRAAVADRPRAPVAADDLGGRLEFVLRDGLRPLRDLEAGAEGGVHTILEVEGEVPALEVFEDVREGVVAATVEV